MIGRKRNNNRAERAIQPSAYFTALFEQLPQSKEDDQLDHLLPWSIKL